MLINNRNVYIHSITFCKTRPLTKKETDFYKSTVTSIIRNSYQNQTKSNQNTNLFCCLFVYLFVNSVICQCIVDCPCHFFTDGLSLPQATERIFTSNTPPVTAKCEKKRRQGSMGGCGMQRCTAVRLSQVIVFNNNKAMENILSFLE